jgi:hypothetical protein
MEPECSLPHSQMPATCLYPESAQSSPWPHIPLLKIRLKSFLPSTPGSPKWSLSLRFPHQNSVHTSPLHHTCCMPRPYHSSRFYHPHNSGWGVQIIKLLIMTSCVTSRKQRHNVTRGEIYIFKIREPTQNSRRHICDMKQLHTWVPKTVRCHRTTFSDPEYATGLLRTLNRSTFRVCEHVLVRLDSLCSLQSCFRDWRHTFCNPAVYSTVKATYKKVTVGALLKWRYASEITSPGQQLQTFQRIALIFKVIWSEKRRHHCIEKLQYC